MMPNLPHSSAGITCYRQSQRTPLPAPWRASPFRFRRAGIWIGWQWPFGARLPFPCRTSATARNGLLTPRFVANWSGWRPWPGQRGWSYSSAIMLRIPAYGIMLGAIGTVKAGPMLEAAWLWASLPIIAVSRLPLLNWTGWPVSCGKRRRQPKASAGRGGNRRKGGSGCSAGNTWPRSMKPHSASRYLQTTSQPMPGSRRKRRS